MSSVVKRNKANVKIVMDYMKSEFSNCEGLTYGQLNSTITQMAPAEFSKLYREAVDTTCVVEPLESSEGASGEIPSHGVASKPKVSCASTQVASRRRMKGYSFQMPPELLERLEAMAERNMTSVSSEIRLAIAARLESSGY